jgi:hypothetical protein
MEENPLKEDSSEKGTVDEPHIIAVIVEKGCVQSVFTSLSPRFVVEVELLDFDNAGCDDLDADALNKARTRLTEIETEYRQIF